MCKHTDNSWLLRKTLAVCFYLNSSLSLSLSLFDQTYDDKERIKCSEEEIVREEWMVQWMKRLEFCVSLPTLRSCSSLQWLRSLSYTVSSESFPFLLSIEWAWDKRKERMLYNFLLCHSKQFFLQRTNREIDEEREGNSSKVVCAF